MIKLKPIALAAMGCGLLSACSAPPPSRPLALQPVVRGDMPGNQAASWNRLARFHHERGQLSLALGAYAQSLALDANQLDARNAVAVIEAQQGNLESARKALVALVNDYPGEAQPHTNLGYVLYLMGDNVAASQTLRRAMALGAGPKAFQNLQLAEAAMGKAPTDADIQMAASKAAPHSAPLPAPAAPAAVAPAVAAGAAPAVTSVLAPVATPVAAPLAAQAVAAPVAMPAASPSAASAAAPVAAQALAAAAPAAVAPAASARAPGSAPALAPAETRTAAPVAAASAPSMAAPAAPVAAAEPVLPPSPARTMAAPLAAAPLGAAKPALAHALPDSPNVARSTPEQLTALPSSREIASHMELVKLTPNVYELRARVAADPVVAPAAPVVAAVAAKPAVQAVAQADRVRMARLEVSNGNGVTGMARRFRSLLGQMGIPVDRLSNDKPYKQVATTIQYSPGFERQAASLQKALQGKVQLTSRQLATTDVRLVLGKDARVSLTAATEAAGLSLVAMQEDSNN